MRLTVGHMGTISQRGAQSARFLLWCSRKKRYADMNCLWQVKKNVTEEDGEEEVIRGSKMLGAMPT